MTPDIRRGVVAVLRNEDNTASLLMPLFIEGRKREQVDGFGEMRQLVKGMWEMIGGGVESDESLEEALKRECVEERQLPLVNVGEILPFSLRVHQEREDKQVTFLVSMLMLQLNEQQKSDLRNRHPLLEIGDDSLISSLQVMGEEALRPLAWATLQVIHKDGLCNRK